MLHEELGYFHPIQYYYHGDIGSKVVLPTETDHNLEWITTNEIENKMYLEAQGWALKKYLKRLRL